MPPPKDYSLTGANAARAVELGLAEADWYQCPVPRAEMRKLLERRDGPALRDTLLWFSLIIGFGVLTVLLWPNWWAVFSYLCYAVLYASSSDSRWHESSHGTAFKTDWMNNTLYEIASFMVMRESVVWRWSHTRHHSDTIIVGRDPEIVVPRPPDIGGLIRGFFNLGVYLNYFRRIVLHSLGRIAEDERTFVPETEYPKVYRRARIYLLIYLGVVASCFLAGSILPLLLVGGVNLFGAWLMPVYGLTQHAGMAENVLDHRLNCRTVKMSLLNRYLYWNMNYHIEHHMFPLVPYHALPRLHALVKNDMPKPYSGLLNAWKEIVPALLKQVEDPEWYVVREIPEPFAHVEEALFRSDTDPDPEGWVEICAAAELHLEEVIQFDYRKKTFAVVRDNNGRLFATDGICTHGNSHLADGLVKEGIIECPKHNGRFNLTDGSPARAPICRGLATYPVEERQGCLWINIENPGGVGARPVKSFSFRVVSNENVASYIKELVLEPTDSADQPEFTPGDYLQLDIPPYGRLNFKSFDIPSPYAETWQREKLFDLSVCNEAEGRRNNYSIANSKVGGGTLRFNVRIATPPAGTDSPPGVGSSYVFNLKAGDTVSAIGPHGDFHIKPTQKEMVYIGGGAGMAPLRAHLSHLFEMEKTVRKVSYWYGARSKQELFYEEYFNRLSEEHHNFDFHVGLSDPLEKDRWDGATGYIHEVVLNDYLKDHPITESIEFYLCGPPAMIKASLAMLSELGVPKEHIAYDEF